MVISNYNKMFLLHYAIFEILMAAHIYLCDADTNVLYDTKSATSDLDWTLYPSNGGWEELSGLDLNGNAIRYHQVCNIQQSGQDNWARSPFIDARSAQRVYIDIEYSVMKCDDCRETFTLYYYPSSSNVASSTFPPWRETPFKKIDTVAAGSRFDSDNAGPKGINKKTLAIGPLSRSGFYIAVQDQGACMSLVSMKLYYYYCPEATFNLAYFPKTIAGGELASLIQVDGKCVSNAVYTNSQVPKYWCNSNGEWKVPSGSCHCRAGHTPNQDGTACEDCPTGFYKSNSGNQRCVRCPARSSTHKTGSTNCRCNYGYFRSEWESIDQSCSRPPSKPTNLAYKLNTTSIMLAWSSPVDTGNRDDVYYSVNCQKCDVAFEICKACLSSLTFEPRNHQHFTLTSSNISGLDLFSNYIFTVTAYNGVSSVALQPAAFSQIHIKTGQDAPLPVTSISLIKSTPQSLTFTWSSPFAAEDEAVTYEVSALAVSTDRSISAGPKIIVMTSLHNVTINDLLPGTTYQVTIRTSTDTGSSQYSDPVVFHTLAVKSKPPTSPQTEENSFLIIAICGAVALLFIVVIVFLFVRRKRRKNREAVRIQSKLSNDSQSHLLENGNLSSSLSGSNTRKTYVDYRDPHQGVKEIACEIDKSKITIDRVIGQGEFGEVCKGKLVEGKNSTTVAVKRLRQGASLLDQTNFLKEACTMAQFHDPNIIEFKGIVTKHMPAMIVSEFMEFGSLDRFLQKKRGELTLLQLIKMLKGIASGMKYLASMKYIHRDLAARNILVDSKLVCKVSDFGLSRTIENDPHATYTTQGGKIALRWTAPECIRHRKFTTASDVWSFGIVMWEVMSYGEKPYWDMTNDEITQVIEDGYRLPSPMNCPQVLHNLMLRCWSYEERRRPTFQEISHQLEQIIRNPRLLQDPVEMLDLSAPLLSPRSPNSIQDVSTLDEWLDMVKLGFYRRSFHENGIKDLETLTHITPNDLERLGIASIEHRSRLQNGLDTLRRHLASTSIINSSPSMVIRMQSEMSSTPTPSIHSFPVQHAQNMMQVLPSRDVALV